MMIKLASCCSLIAVLGLAQPAQTTPPRLATTPETTVELIASPSSGRLDGRSWLGLKFTLREQWHVYWRNPGDSGEPPRVTWHLPRGVTVGTLEWPAPSRLPVGSLVNYGYEGQVVFPVSLHADSTGLERPLVVSADVRWLVCHETCIPGRATLGITLRPSDPAPADSSGWGASIAAARAALPSPQPAAWTATARADRDYFTLTIRAPTVLPIVTFLPLREMQIDDAAAQEIAEDAGGSRIRLKKSDQLITDPATLEGVVRLASGRSFNVAARITRAPSSAPKEGRGR